VVLSIRQWEYISARISTGKIKIKKEGQNAACQK
jgi:hypothetical protein